MVKERDDVIEDLRIRTRDAEQYDRNKNIEISGLEVAQNVNLVEVMRNIATLINVPFEEGDMDVIHRLPSRRSDTRPPRVIAQFLSRKKRNMWLKNKYLHNYQ